MREASGAERSKLEAKTERVCGSDWCSRGGEGMGDGMGRERSFVDQPISGWHLWDGWRPTGLAEHCFREAN